MKIPAVFCETTVVSASTIAGFIWFLFRLLGSVGWKTYTGMLDGVKMRLAQHYVPTDNFDDRIVKKCLQGLKVLTGKAQLLKKMSKPVTTKSFCTPDVLLQCLPHWRDTTTTQKNSKFAAIVALAGTFRLGELCGTVHNLNVTPKRKDLTRPTMDSRRLDYICKTDKWFNGQHKILLRNKAKPSLCGVSAIDMCILGSHACRIGSRPLFCNDDGTPLSVKSVMFEFHRSMRLAGLSTQGFTSKCFRRGSVKNATADGASEKEIKKLGPWKSNAWKCYLKQ